MKPVLTTSHLIKEAVFFVILCLKKIIRACLELQMVKRLVRM